MRDQIKRLHAQLGATMLYVTHDQEEAMTLGSRLALLRHGRIQQIGSPLDVFHRPANRFVAGFLGSPPMNFLEGTVLSQDGRLWFDDGSQRLAVPERAEPSLASRRGTRLLLGVRPEHLAMCPFAGQSGNCLTARVVAVEPLGSRADVFLATERQPRIVALLEWPVPLTPGAVAQMYVDWDRIHFFDADDDCGQRARACVPRRKATARARGLLTPPRDRPKVLPSVAGIEIRRPAVGGFGGVRRPSPSARGFGGSGDRAERERFRRGRETRAERAERERKSAAFPTMPRGTGVAATRRPTANRTR